MIIENHHIPLRISPIIYLPIITLLLYIAFAITGAPTTSLAMLTGLFIGITGILNWWHLAITIWWPWRKYPRIYIPADKKKTKYADISSHYQVMKHENIHVLQWLNTGRFKFLVRYVFNRKHRLEYECEAFCVDIYRWIQRGATLDEMIDHYAEVLNNPWKYLLFFFPLDIIKAVLRDAWNKSPYKRKQETN